MSSSSRKNSASFPRRCLFWGVLCCFLPSSPKNGLCSYERMTEGNGEVGLLCVMIVGQISRLAPLARDDRVEWVARDDSLIVI